MILWFGWCVPSAAPVGLLALSAISSVSFMLLDTFMALYALPGIHQAWSLLFAWHILKSILDTPPVSALFEKRHSSFAACLTHVREGQG